MPRGHCDRRSVRGSDRTGPFTYGCVLITAFLVALPNPSLANWWIVRSSDKQCLVVDIEPTGKDKSVTKIGKEVYLTREEAEAEAKQLCKQ